MVLWDLNHSLGCSPLAIHAYRASPFPNFYGVVGFGVGQGTDPFQGLNSQSVALPQLLPLLGLYCGIFRQEPAISGLDWLFTPSPRLEEHLSVAPLQASTRFYPGFTLPWARSTGFGSYPSDSGHFRTPPLVKLRACRFRLAVKLATRINSLARYSKRTMQPRRAASNHSC